MITPFRQIRGLWRKLKYRRMRANHVLPPEDWWDFHYTLSDIIKQGLEGLLKDGVTDWDAPCHKQEKKDLEFVLAWARDFPYYASAIIAMDEQDMVELKKKFPPEEGTLILYGEDWKEWQKRQDKAFKLLSKNFMTLWD